MAFVRLHQVMQTFSAGVDHTIPLVPSGVTLCSARGAHDTAVAEWILAALLGSFRQLHNFYQRQLAGKWDRATEDLVHLKTPSVGRLQSLKVTSRMILYCTILCSPYNWKHRWSLKLRCPGFSLCVHIPHTYKHIRMALNAQQACRHVLLKGEAHAKSPWSRTGFAKQHHVQS